MAIFRVTNYYSGFCQTLVEAKDEDEAMYLAEDYIDFEEVTSNLESNSDLTHAEQV